VHAVLFRINISVTTDASNTTNLFDVLGDAWSKNSIYSWNINYDAVMLIAMNRLFKASLRNWVAQELRRYPIWNGEKTFEDPFAMQ
jgi:hypothetical protein